MPQRELGGTGRVEAIVLQDRVLERPERVGVCLFGRDVAVDGDVDDRAGGYAGREEYGRELDEVGSFAWWMGCGQYNGIEVGRSALTDEDLEKAE